MHECSSLHENIYCNVHLNKNDFILKFFHKKIGQITVGRMAGPRGLG